MKKRVPRALPTIIATLFIGLLVAEDLPVIPPELPRRDRDILNPFTWDDLHEVTVPDDRNVDKKEGLQLNLPADLNGKIITGPYPYEYGESDYDYARYRSSKALKAGIGEIEIDRYFSQKYNPNDWPKGQCEDPMDCPTPTIGYRVATENGKFFDGRTSFTCEDCKKGPWFPSLTIIAGPFISMVTSDNPSEVNIAVETDDECNCEVKVGGQKFKKTFPGDGPKTKNHEISIKQLTPEREYTYQVFCNGESGKVRSGKYTFKTAPLKSPRPFRGKNKKIVFAFASDSREGTAGEAAFMGHNLKILSQVANEINRRGAELFIFGGDLVNAYTTETWDFRFQLKGWKKTMEGFWRSHPVYPAMGNHEILLACFDNGSTYGISLDKWPYKTESSEAVFAQELFNPSNGPKTSDPRRPSYDENVYKHQYGPVLFIAFNNNYWWTRNIECKNFGGSPEGYMLDDQLTWIENVLKNAETDKTVKYIFLYGQEPVFPAGGHVNDAMWYKGNNNMKAYFKDTDGKVKPAGPGIVEVRNRFWKAISNSSKVAAVLVGDEHSYHRLLVNNQTPVGVFPKDDTDNDGVLDKYSPNPEFKNPTWQIHAGNAGAPWYNREDTPWDVEKYVSRNGYLIFEATQKGVSMTAYALTGREIIDRVDNLMAVKK